MKRIIIFALFLLSLNVFPTLAYIAAYDWFYIYDVTDPDSVYTVVDTFVTNGYFYPACYDVWVKDNYAYLAVTTDIVSWWEYGGMYVYDISNPANPTFVSEASAIGDGYNIYIQGTLAYLVTRDVIWYDPPLEEDGGIYIYDISDPLHPVLEDSMTLPGNPSDIFVDGPYVYVGTGDSLFILKYPPQGIEEDNNSNKPIIRVEGSRLIIQFMGSKQAKLDIDLYDLLGRKLKSIKKDITTGNNYISIDISNLSNGVYFLPLNINNKVYRNKFIKIGNRIDVKNATLKISYKSQLHRIAAMGTSALNICGIHGYVFVTPDSNGFRSIDVTDPYNPVKKGRVEGIGDEEMDIKDTLIYTRGFHTINISNPAEPIRIDSSKYRLSKGMGVIKVKGSKAYMTGNYLQIYDISDPHYYIKLYQGRNMCACDLYVK